VEWVEVAGKTVDEATEQALDQLGVGPGDAEVIIVNEPKMGLFGRVRVEVVPKGDGNDNAVLRRFVTKREYVIRNIKVIPYSI